MALIKCPECGKEISDTAKQCPHCGFTLKTNIDTAKQAASVAGNAVRNGFLKYGEAVIPIILLLAGMIYLISEYDHAYYGFYVAEDNTINTPFDDFEALWLPLFGTIVLPIVSLILCRRARKKVEQKESAIIQNPRFSKKIVFGMVLVYFIGFAILSALFYFDYANAKEEQSQIIANGTTIASDTSSNTKWIYHGDENIVGARIHYATISSEEDETITLNLTYDPDNYIEVNDLVAKYFDKSIDIVSSRATIKRGIAFKFDDGGVISLTPSTNPSNDVYITDKSISIRDESADFNRLMSLLKSSKVCKIEITTSKGIITYTFNVAGLKWPAF